MTLAHRGTVCDRRLFVWGALTAGVAATAAVLGGCSGTSESVAADDAPAAADATVADGQPADDTPALTETAGEAASPGTFGTATPQSTTAVVYFSVPLVNSQSRDADSGASIVLSGDEVLGNVQYVAQYVAAMTGGDLLRIETTVPYPTDDAIFDYALSEQNNNDRPEISLVAADGTVAARLDGYDTVLVGYPIWWYELPMPLYTFFENYDLSGKRVAPFVVHGGSGLSGTVQDIEALQPDAATEENGLSINRSNVLQVAESSVADWLSQLGLN